MGVDHQQSRTSTADLQRQREEKAALIARLLSHYWTADDPPATRRAQAEDWLESLSEFSAAAVASACQEWRENQTRRPMIAEIRVMSREADRVREKLSLPDRLRLAAPKAANCWEPNYDKRYEEPWFLALPFETQRRYREQDFERLDVWRRLQSGEASEDEWLAVCRRQVFENLGTRL